MRSLANLPLYWRVCLINGLVFIGGTTALVLSPATASPDVLVSEGTVLLFGLTVILIMNALLLRASFAPLDRLIRLMEDVDLQRPGLRLPDTGHGTVRNLVQAFNAMLTRLQAERRRSSAQALAAQEAERHRIAQELHDEVGQGLTVVLLGLKRVIDRAPKDIAAELQLVQDAARSSLTEVQHVARRLRPGVLEDLGLLSALAALATDFTAHCGAHVRRGFEPGLPALSADTELVIYRVAQEALTNAARHADADTVELFLGRQGSDVLLRVADNGRGMPRHAEGSGIRGMRERASLVEGSVTIGPRLHGGTELRLQVPLRSTPTPGVMP